MDRRIWLLICAFGAVTTAWSATAAEKPPDLESDEWRKIITGAVKHLESAAARPAFPPPRQYAERLEGVLEHEIFTVKTTYQSHARLIVYRILRNIGRRPVEICLTCFDEAVGLLPLDRTPQERICGSLASHVPGFKPRMRTLTPGEVIEAQDDLTDRSCGLAFYGFRKYRIHSVYCYPGKGREHGLDPPEYCIEAKPLTIEFAPGGAD